MCHLVIEEAVPEDFPLLAEIAADVFKDDKFFQKLIPQADIRPERLYQMYKEGMEICQKNFGGVLKVRKEKTPIGFLMYFNYHKFRRRNLKDFLKTFDGYIKRNKLFPKSFEKIHRLSLNTGKNSIFVLAIAVAIPYQNKGIGTALFEDFMKRFQGLTIFGDVSGPFFRKICVKEGFKIQPLSETCELVIKGARSR